MSINYPSYAGPQQTGPRSHLPQKNWVAAMLLSLFLGTLGVDRFYLGQIGLGIAKLLLSWATFGIWQIIDFLLVASRKANGVFSWDDEPAPGQLPERSHGAALVISFFLGGLGVDRFYVGHVGLGVAKFFLNWATCGIWWLVDFILFCLRRVDNSGFNWRS